MAYLGEALKRLEPDRRGQWPEILPELEFAHATVESASTSLTPFEVNHGSPAKTVLSAFPLEKLDDGTAVPSAGVAQGLYGRIHEAASLYRQVAQDQQKVASDATSARLNDGKRGRQYEVGQRVSIYMPSRALTKG